MRRGGLRSIQCLPNTLLFPSVLTCIKAYAHPALIFNSFDNLRQLFKLAAQHVSRPCLSMTHASQYPMKGRSRPSYHVLDNSDDVLRRLVGAIKRRRDMCHRFVWGTGTNGGSRAT